jgi:hypothetical protein
VRYVVLAIIALALSLLQYGWLARSQVTPDLPLALAAWAMVDGTEDGVLWRAWLVGLLADLIDPGSDCFHAVAFLLLALAYLPVRSLVFRTRVAGWGGWAAICSLLLAIGDGWVGGFGDSTWKTMALAAAETALAAMAIGWLFGGLPGALQPVGRGGA